MIKLKLIELKNFNNINNLQKRTKLWIKKYIIITRTYKIKSLN